MKHLSLLVLLGCLFSISTIAQKRTQKSPPPEWTEREYLDLTYPEDSYLKVLDQASIKKLSDSEIVTVKKNLFKRMEEELARKISTQVNVETEQTSSSQSNISIESNSSNARTQFREKLSITVNAKFKFQLKQTYPDKNILWAVMVINKEQCSLPLVIEALDILETTINQVVVALDSRSSKYLLDFETKLNLASQLQSTAIWLYSDVDLGNYRILKNKLAELIQRVRQLESEQKLDEAIAEVDELIYNHHYAEAIGKARRLTYKFRDRIEILELITRVNDQYRQYIQLQLHLNKDDLKKSVNLVEDYLFYFPDDLIMISTIETLETRHFNTIANKAELAIDSDKLNIAKELVLKLENIKIIDLDRLKDIQKSLERLEFNELMRSLKSYWDTDEFYSGWNTVNYLLNSSTKYLDNKTVLEWKNKFGKKCEKIDFKEARKTKPYKMGLSFMGELRTNEGNVSELLNENNPYTVTQGYFAYSTGIYIRHIESSDVKFEDGKTKDKSTASLYGIKLCYLDYTSVQKLGSYDGDIYDISTEEMGWEVSLDIYYVNFFHLEAGVHHDGYPTLTSEYTPDNYFGALGIHIPFNGRRGNFAVLGDIVFTKEPNSDATYRLRAGISWNPYLFKSIDNKKTIREKYR